MSKLKIKTESPPERCEVCHKSDCFDPETNYCSRCNTLGTIFNNSPAATHPILQIERPVNVAAEDDGSLTISFPTGSRKELAMPMIILVIMSLQVIGRRIGGSFWFALLVVLLNAYAAAALYLNRTVVKITRDEITIRSVPLPYDFARRLKLSDLRSIEYEKRHNTDRLYAVLNNGKRKNILSGRDIPQLLTYIKRETESRVQGTRIKNQRPEDDAS